MISRPTMSVTTSFWFVSAIAREEMRCPSRNTVTLSHSSKTSSSLWVTYRIPMPMSRSRRITSKRSLISFGVRAEVGSSMMTTLASWERARAISTICCWDTVSLDTCTVGSRSSPMESDDLAGPGIQGLPVDCPVLPQGEGLEKHVLCHREPLDQRELLENDLDPPLEGVVRRVQLDGRPVEEDLPRVPPVHTARILISVDLPAPFSPTSACTSPLRTDRSTPDRAWTPGNSFAMPRTSR